MLTAKYSRIHGMKNEKWNTREKISQYRAIIKLQAREKKLQSSQGVKLKKKIAKSIRELNKDVYNYHEIISDFVFGDKRRLRTVLQKEKAFQVVLQDAKPLVAYQAIFQDYNLKRKQLDVLLHVHKKTKNDICEIRSEIAELNDRVEESKDVSPYEAQLQTRQQWLMTRYQVALAKRHAAQAVNDTYLELLTILQKDSMYFDGVLNALRIERRDQCLLIYKSTTTGQLAAENLDDVRTKYKEMVNAVWVNMKERERSLDVTRKQAEDVWEYAKSLVRIESEPNLLKKKADKTSEIDRKLERQILHLEKILHNMKDSLLIRSFEELFIRLEGQVKQRERLSSLYTKNLKKRDFVLNKKNHAEVILQNLEHTMVSTTTKYKSEKKEMLEKIKEEKKRLADNSSMIETRGELLMKIRSALQNMSAMLICVPAIKLKGKDGKKAAMRDKETESVADDKSIDEKSSKKADKAAKCQDPIETEGLAVLMQVIRKATTLFNATNFAMNKDRQQRAKDMYENYVANHKSHLKFGDEEPEQGMYFEHETVDPSVPTRAEIKQKSKQIVEINTKED